MKYLTPLWFLAALLLFGCDSNDDQAGTFLGASKQLGNGTAQSWVRLNEAGNPVSLGVTLTEAALTNLPQHGDHENNMLTLALPKEASHTPFDHISLDWNPMGHEPPGIYDLPHFDFHFYMISEAERAAITPADPNFASKGTTLPQGPFIPQGYISPPGNAPVPLMGTHLLDPGSPELNGQVFTKTLIWGFYDAKISFIEPMITKAFIESVKASNGQAVTAPIPQPQQFAKAGFYPTKYSVRYDAAKKEYTIALEELVKH